MTVRNLSGVVEELRGLIHAGIPLLLELTSDQDSEVQSNAVALLSKLASYGE